MSVLTTQSQIAPNELQRKLDAGEHLFILDVRAEEEYADWRIEAGDQVSMINVPYFHYLEDPDDLFARVPMDSEIVVVCAKGGASDYLVDDLRQKGYDAKNLEGGMLAWSQLYSVRQIVEARQSRTTFDFWQVIRVAKGCLSYVIGSDGEALVVDPGRHEQTYLDLAEQHGLAITHVIDTHLHADHISGGRTLAEMTGATYHLPPADAQDFTYGYTPLNDGDIIKVGNKAVQALALHTPGHTPGSTSLVVEDEFLMTGDTLFVASAGRPDLGGMAESWVHDLYETLFVRLKELDDSVRIYPAHYGDLRELNGDGVVTATMGELRKSNPVLQFESKDRFVGEVLGSMLKHPANYTDIRQVNKGVKRVAGAEATEMEIGPNRCAVTE